MLDFVQPNYTTDSGSAYATNIDNAVAAINEKLLSRHLYDWRLVTLDSSNTAFKNIRLNSVCAAQTTSAAPYKRTVVAVGNADGTDAYLLVRRYGGIGGTGPSQWHERGNPKNINLFGIAHGAGVFCAVGAADGTDAYLITSPDGLNWTERANPKNVQLNGVVWSETLSLFIAVGAADGSDAYLITSPDGLNWTERANPKNVQLNSITKNAGFLVAVGNSDGSDTYIVTSADGITWTERTSPVNYAMYGVHFANSLYVAVGAGTPSAGILTSTDGITWVSRAEPGGKTLFAVNWTGIAWTAVGGELAGAVGISYIVSLDNGVTWTAQSHRLPAYTLYGRAIAQDAEGMFIVGGIDSGTGIRCYIIESAP